MVEATYLIIWAKRRFDSPPLYPWTKVVNGTLKQVRALRIIRITAHGKIWRFGTRTWNRYLILKLYRPPKKVYEYPLSLSSDTCGSVTLSFLLFLCSPLLINYPQKVEITCRTRALNVCRLKCKGTNLPNGKNTFPEQSRRAKWIEMLGFYKLYIMFSKQCHQKCEEESIFVPAKRLVTIGFLKSVSCGIIKI